VTFDRDPAGERLRELADEYWQAFLAFEPVFATSLGDRRFDSAVPSRSPEAIARHRATLNGVLRGARAIEASGLAAEDRVTLSELIAAADRDTAALAHDFEAWTVDPIEGPPVQALDLEAFQPARTPADGRALVGRWRAIEGWIDEHSANLRRGLADGRVAVRTPVEKAITILDVALDATPDEAALLAPARATHDDWPAAELEAFRRDVAAAVDEAVLPAFRRLRGVLADEILPRARSDEAPGVAGIPGGADAYRDLIRYHTSLPLTPDELHATGLAEVARIDAELESLGGRVLRTSGLADTIARLRGDPSLHFTTRDEVYEKAEEALANAREAIPGWFGRLPRAGCVVVRMGAHEEEHSTIGYYRQPAADGSRPGEYFINTSAPETRPRYEAEALAFHESIPGHHLQIAIGQELEGLPDFRRHLGPTAFFEGWGLYTERLAEEMGLYSGDVDRFGVLSFDAWRACRLVVDTGMHAFGWSRQRAIDFMLEHTALGPNNIANEVDRYIVWPGQSLAYKTGQLEMLRLRTRAETVRGPRFDVRAFHDVLLGSGAVSLTTLASQVEEWAAS
jgi:uncharacterized protein (DUF885 family)